MLYWTDQVQAEVWYPDWTLKIKNYPDLTRTRSLDTRTRPGLVNFGLVHPLILLEDSQNDTNCQKCKKTCTII